IMNFPPKSPMYKQEIPEGTGNSGTGLNVSHSSSSSSSSSSTTVKTQYSDEVTKSILRSAIHLTGKNYLTWSNHTAALLDLNGLWDVVSKPPKGRKFVSLLYASQLPGLSAYAVLYVHTRRTGCLVHH